MQTTQEQPKSAGAVSSTRLLSTVLAIMLGLLASGHYTQPWDGEGDPPESSILRCDNGRDWKELDIVPVFARRHTTLAVSDAIDLAEELIRQCEIDEYAKSITDDNWNRCKRKGLSEMRPYADGESMSGISISDADKLNGSPKAGDMIARNPKNHDDQWLVAAKYFSDNFEPA